MNAIEMKDLIFKQIFEELSVFLGLHARSISFPELVVPIRVALHRFRKRCGNPSYGKVVQKYLEMIDKNEK